MVLTSAVLIGLALMAAGGGTVGGIKLGQGIKDKKKGEAMEAELGDRPEYEMPESFDKMLSTYQDMGNATLPGEDLIKQNIEAQSAKGVGQIGQLAAGSPEAMTGLLGLKDQENAALRDLQIRSAQFQANAKLNSQQGMAGVYGQQAGYETEIWRQNQLLPWEIGMNTARDYQTKGKGNVMAGVDTLGSTASQVGGTLAGGDWS